MKQSTCLETEDVRIRDLWEFLHCAEQLVVNHEKLHEPLHECLSKCLQVVESYHDVILEQLYPDSDLTAELKEHKHEKH